MSPERRCSVINLRVDGHQSLIGSLKRCNLEFLMRDEQKVEPDNKQKSRSGSIGAFLPSQQSHIDSVSVSAASYSGSAFSRTRWRLQRFGWLSLNHLLCPQATAGPQGELEPTQSGAVLAKHDGHCFQAHGACGNGPLRPRRARARAANHRQ